MDSNALKDAASSGAGPEDDSVRALLRQAARFLKAEAFYLAVLIWVAVPWGFRVERSLNPQEEERPGQRQLLQKQLDAVQTHYMDDARKLSPPPRAVALVESVETLRDEYLFYGGVVVALALALTWAVRVAGPHERSHAEAAPEPERGGVPLPLWNLWDVLKLAALFAAGWKFFHYIFPLSPVRPFSNVGDWVAEIFAAALLVGAMFHIVVAERGGRLRNLGFRGRFFSSVGIGLTAFLVIQPFLKLFAILEERAALKGWIPDLPVQDVLQKMVYAPTASVLTIATVVAVVVAPISEELLYRSFLQPVLQRWSGRWMGIVLSAAFFGAAHMDLYALPTLLVLGFALGYVYDRTRSLVAPVVLHMAFNAMTMLWVFAFRALESASPQ